MTTAKSAPPAAPDAGKTKAPLSQPTAMDPWPLTGEYAYMSIDRAFKANLARLTLGLSPAVLAEQTFDWLAHLAIDATRLPYRMHSEYLRRLFLNNDFAEGRYEVEGRPVSLTDVRIPSFVVGTGADHVAPWRSVYKVHLVLSDELTFVLASGGHNAGIVSEPGHAGRTYQIRTRQPAERYLDPQSWQGETVVRQGSWWPEWESWLARHSTARVPPPSMAAAAKGYLARQEAPGSYVRQA